MTVRKLIDRLQEEIDAFRCREGAEVVVDTDNCMGQPPPEFMELKSVRVLPDGRIAVDF